LTETQHENRRNPTGQEGSVTRYASRANIINIPQDNPPPSLTSYGTHNDYSIQITEMDPWRNTGILDASGQAIWATDTIPLGFGRAP
jgi:gamma-glutamyl:cysteine ligase YbdK (ATP-grasp superfamily)